MPQEDGLEDRGTTSPGKFKNRKSQKDTKSKRRAGADSDPLAHLASMDIADVQMVVGQMSDKYQGMCEDHDRMIQQGKKEQQDFIRREVQYKSQISRMKELLDKAVLSRGGDEVGMPKIRETHAKIMVKLADMQQQTRAVMADQEQEMLRLFRARLFEVEDRLRKSNQRKGQSEVVGGVPRSWMEKATKLSRELDHYKEESMRLDGENERLSKESNGLQVAACACLGGGGLDGAPAAAAGTRTTLAFLSVLVSPSLFPFPFPLHYTFPFPLLFLLGRAKGSRGLPQASCLKPRH
uniref:Uncharacterized protein n=1 Tax=Hemiselmis andersenii TaxID=464988 RepID=A0A7S1HM75_HEMAN